MREIVISGACVVPPAGADPSSPVWGARPPRLGRMDRFCALGLAAAHGALASAALAFPLDDAARFAVVVGTRFGCHSSNEAWYTGLLAEGVRGASPRLFAYTLPSSPLGEICIHLGARGPGETMADGRHAGLEAAMRAEALCASGRADRALAVAVEVDGGTLPGFGYTVQTGAASLLFEAASLARARSGPERARLVACGSAFATGPDEARKDARRLALASLPSAAPGERAVAELHLADSDGAMDALSALCVFVLAEGAPGQRGMVSVSDEGGGAAAAVLERLGA